MSTSTSIRDFVQADVTEALIDEAMPLLEAHWREISHYPDIPLSVDRDAYVAAARAGFIRAYLCREEGALRGYAVYFVRRHMHYTSSLTAVQDVLYLAPELRGQALGAAFIQWCDEQLWAEGVQVVTHHVKLAHDFGPTLAALGYEHVEAMWQRRLDRG